ncbi:MAG: ABC transporter substrate-binding protein [Thermoplasmata archaeon]
MIVASFIFISVTADANPIPYWPSPMQPFEPPSSTNGQIEPPPYGSFNSSIYVIPSLIGFNYLPNLYLFATFLLLVCELRGAKTGNIGQTKKRFLLDILTAVAAVTIIGSAIDTVFLYEKTGEYYQLTYNAMNWVIAAILIFISVLLASVFVLRIGPSSAMVPALGVSGINPFFWYLIYGFKPDAIYIAILSLAFLPPSIFLLMRLKKWHSNIYGQDTYPSPEGPTGAGKANVREFLGTPLIRSTIALAISVIIVFATLASTVGAEIEYREKSSELAVQAELSIGLPGNIFFLNPYWAVDDNDLFTISLIYDRLTTIDEDLKVSPNLAKSWWYLDGETAAATGTYFETLVHHKNATDWPLGSIWEYNLTESAYWRDGILFTADDVLFTINMQIGPLFATYWSYQQCTRWIDHVEKVNDFKVRIFFCDYGSKTPVPVAFGDVIDIPMMPKHAFEGKPYSYIAQEWDGFPAIGTGPFYPYNLSSDGALTLLKNRYYNFTEGGVRKGLGAAYGRSVDIDKLVIRFFGQDLDAIESAARQGKLDVCTLDYSTFSQWKAESTLPAYMLLQAGLTPYSYSKEIAINDYHNIGSGYQSSMLRLDPAVQRACALSTNKEYIKDVVYRGFAEIGYGLTTPVTPQWFWEPDDTPSTFNVYGAVYNSTSGKYELSDVVYSYTKPMNEVMEYDIAEANRILDAAGYVWANESGMIVRKAGPIAAQRMEAMGFGNASSFLNKTLVFEHVVQADIYEDRMTGDFLVGEWEKIGVWISSDGGPTHAISLVNTATWNQLVYSYYYDTTQTYLSGDIDPNYLCYAPTSYALYGWNEFGTERADYDALYMKTVTTLNPTERKHWVDECQKWIYLSGCIMVTVYPMTCFAMNNQTWEGWGNWTEHPGTCFWNTRCASPLWFNLTPVEKASAFVLDAADYLAILAFAIGLIVIVAIAIQYRNYAEKLKR